MNRNQDFRKKSLRWKPVRDCPVGHYVTNFLLAVSVSRAFVNFFYRDSKVEPIQNSVPYSDWTLKIPELASETNIWNPCSSVLVRTVATEPNSPCNIPPLGLSNSTHTFLSREIWPDSKNNTQAVLASPKTKINELWRTCVEQKVNFVPYRTYRQGLRFTRLKLFGKILS